ncbi:hypothetical protein AAVH_24172, partial [Aphelenchoides avenae]
DLIRQDFWAEFFFLTRTHLTSKVFPCLDDGNYIFHAGSYANMNNLHEYVGRYVDKDFLKFHASIEQEAAKELKRIATSIADYDLSTTDVAALLMLALWSA